MDVIDEEHLEEVLADVSPVGEELSEEPPDEPPILQGLPGISVSRSELALDNLALVIDDQVELESVEPSHRALSLGSSSLHRPMLLLTFDVEGGNRRGIDDGYTRAPAEGSGLKEDQQMDSHLRLTLHKTVIGYGMGKVLAHVLADIAQVE